MVCQGVWQLLASALNADCHLLCMLRPGIVHDFLSMLLCIVKLQLQTFCFLITGLTVFTLVFVQILHSEVFGLVCCSISYMSELQEVGLIAAVM